MKMFIVLLILLSGCSYLEPPVRCDETAGLEAIHIDELKIAYDAVKNCQYSSDASGKILHNLHILIFPKMFGSYNSMEERISASYRLSCRSALKGYRLAVSSMSFLYLHGDSYLSVKPNPQIRACLLNISSVFSEYVDPDNVRACLSLNQSINTSYQCY